MKMIIRVILTFILLSFISNLSFSQLHVTNKFDDSTDRFIGYKLMGIETSYNDDYLYACPPYPTPALDKVHTLVFWDKRYDFNKAEINVYNTEGTKICGKDRISISQQSDWSSIVTWNATGFPFGIYIILIKHGSKTIAIKVAIG